MNLHDPESAAGVSPPVSQGNPRAQIPRPYAARLANAALCCALLTSTAFAGLPLTDPAAVGFDPARIATIEPLIEAGIADGNLPGCVVCIGRHGRIAWLKAYGAKQVLPDVVPMTTDTLFDMASITKPVATATSIMVLIERGQLALSDKVITFLPDFGVHGKDVITIRDLLIHQSGLLPDNALKDYLDGPELALQRICELKLQNPVGAKFVYSDVNFILLGEIVKRVTGQDVNQFSREAIFGPLGMTETGYLPDETLRARAAPTEQRNGTWMRGEVHDPRAYELGGVAGHAGLFSTAEDLAVYAQMMLGDGAYDGRRILSPRTVAMMTRGEKVSSGIRGLGWDKWTGYSINRGALLSDAAFGHGGFTGTVLWIDPELDLFFIFLSNRVHPDGKGLVNPLAGRILSVVAASVQPNVQLSPGGDGTQSAPSTVADGTRSVPATGANGTRSVTATQVTAIGEVLTGIDVLRQENFRRLAGQKVGLITNHTGRARDGKSTVELLHQADGVELTALFSPEHGFAGALDVAKIGDTEDAATGLKVYSLYGETRRPTAAMLANVDTLVFDIQDIGARFYTYVSTMGEAMRAAAEHKKRFVVLDRPNPINGVDVAGPVQDEGKESFVGYHTLPVRHGMTTGELALLFKDEFKLDLELEIIECAGWRRADYWDATGLTWVNPSPNMRSLTEALLYPGIGLLEYTNLSVGRGTDTPFEVIGAPWLDGQKLAAALQAQRLPGVTFIPIEFTPASSKFAHERCGGINIAITDRAVFEPLRTGLAVALQLRTTHPDTWETKHYARLLGNDATFNAVVDARPLADVLQLTQQGLNEFARRRARHLLY